MFFPQIFTHKTCLSSRFREIDNVAYFFFRENALSPRRWKNILVCILLTWNEKKENTEICWMRYDAKVFLFLSLRPIPHTCTEVGLFSIFFFWNMEITFSLSSSVGESLQTRIREMDMAVWEVKKRREREKDSVSRRVCFAIFVLVVIRNFALQLSTDWAKTDQFQRKKDRLGGEQKLPKIVRFRVQFLVFGGSLLPSLSFSLSSVKSTQGPFPPPQGQKRTRRSPFFLLLFSSRERRRRRRRTPHTQTHNRERKKPADEIAKRKLPMFPLI